MQTKFIKLAILLCVGFFLTSCEPSVIKLPKKIKKDSYTFDSKIVFKNLTSKPWNSNDDYEAYLVNVNYDTQENSMIFLNTVTLKQTSLPHDVWDIAIVTDEKEPFVVANSGDYGRGVKFQKMPQNWTPQNAIGMPAVDVRNVSFAEHKKNPTPYQEEANPLKDAMKNGAWYLVTSWNNTFTDMQVFAIRFKPNPEPKIGSKMSELNVAQYKIRKTGDAGSEIDDPYKTIESVDTNNSRLCNRCGFFHSDQYTLADDYSMIYISLRDKKILNGETQGESFENNPIPKKYDWHILFNRTDFYSKEMGDIFKNDGIVGDSSILINKQAGVEVAPMYGWDFTEVNQAPSAKYFKNNLDVIGGGYVNPVSPDLDKLRKAWYYGENMPPTFFLNQNTYVIKAQTQDEKTKQLNTDYSKIRLGSFYGPNGEKFYVRFRWQLAN